MISHKHQCIFIHIPKVAGTSITTLLHDGSDRNSTDGWDPKKQIWRQHATCQELLSLGIIDAKTFGNYFKFTFVRNPWARMVSEYTWRVKNDESFFVSWLPIKKFSKNRTLIKFKRYFSMPRFSFKQFLLLTNESITKNRSEKYKREWEQHSRQQMEFFTDQNRNMMVDFIGRYENLAVDWNHIAMRLNMKNIALPHKNVSKKADYVKYYDRESVEIVKKRFRDDIEYFNYEFGQ